MNANKAAARVLKRAIAATYHDLFDYVLDPRQSGESSKKLGLHYKMVIDEDGESTDPWIQNNIDITCRSAASPCSGSGV